MLTNTWYQLEALVEKFNQPTLSKRWQVPYRLLIATLPILLASLFLPEELVAIIMLLSLPWIYAVFVPVQAELYELTVNEVQWCALTPFYWYCLGWGLLAASLDRIDQLGNTVGSVVILLVCAIWPLYRRKKAETEAPDIKVRLRTYKVWFTTLSFLVVFQQLYIAWHSVTRVVN